MQTVFVQIRCKPGTTYDVAFKIVLKEIHAELFSTSGEYDLLVKLIIPKEEDIGRYINERLGDVEGIERTLTTLTFKAF
ncbi:Lrp/AsnC ligand binding domain-containing protein [Alterinioella nitratireducens]|uniref:Lrp/AsnC ligand binding domain-containing protein n=1 Tax=Alterinioella nitratireducens TaxID=2735915 RepID=UPI000C924273|nr:Lrp/AsnC ligand binding domain-containing protein [Alterinioella nitratireducens]MAN15181.1 AsnC family transcriptional regulator [Dinoroseobacter sp.]NPD20854.1 Lrp/AsnC family transcriptional regulator [Alterinioella nitratireducens]|tara:strand:+ start:505 stop:741 length:237 start_codon:yes stop_codon:yes gene_type:complete